MTAVLVVCPECDGGGEIGTHQNYWGIWETASCRLCRGEGDATPERIAEWNDAEWEGP